MSGDTTAANRLPTRSADISRKKQRRSSTSTSRVRNHRIRESLNKSQRALRDAIISTYPEHSTFAQPDIPDPEDGIIIQGANPLLVNNSTTTSHDLDVDLGFQQAAEAEDESSDEPAIDNEESGEPDPLDQDLNTYQASADSPFIPTQLTPPVPEIEPAKARPFHSHFTKAQDSTSRLRVHSPPPQRLQTPSSSPSEPSPQPSVNIDAADEVAQPENDDRHGEPFTTQDRDLQSVRYLAAARLFDHLASPPSCETCSNRLPQLRPTTKHCSLLETLKPQEEHTALPYVLDSDSLLAARTAKSARIRHPSISHALTGRDTRNEDPPIIDLGLDVCKEPSTPVVTYDCDSFIVFLKSLAALKNGLAYFPCSNPTRLINADLHFKSKYEVPGNDGSVSSQSLEFRRIPHLLFGLIGNSKNLSVYMAFPRLYRPDRKTSILTDDQLAFFHDEIVLKAMSEVLDSGTMQHHALSYATSSLRTKARQVEMRSKSTASYASAQYAGNLIPPEKLGRLYESMQRFALQSGREDFVGMQLFVDAKNLKLEHRLYGSDTSLEALLENTFSYMQTEFDMDYVSPEDFYLDIGQEITAPHWSAGSSQPDNHADECQTYFFKDCCLRTWCNSLFEDGAERHAQFFSNFLLPEAANMRYTTRRKDVLGRAGVPYIQAYACFKESLDYMKTMPFQGDFEALAVDPSILETASRAGGGGILTHDVPSRAYCHSKTRTHESLEAAARRSYGRRLEIRGEHGFWWEFLRCIRNNKEIVTLPNAQEANVDPPAHCWILPTRTVTDYVSKTANKFAAIFELTDLDAKRKNYDNYRSMQLMTVALRLLKVFMGATDINLDLAVAASRESRSSGKVRGLGLRKAFQKYNFPWIEPIIKDSEYAVRASCSQELLFGNRILRSKYRARYHRVSSIEEDSTSILQCVDWLRKYPSDFNRDEIVLFMVHVILRRFRRDVYQADLPDIKASRSGHARETPGEDDMLLTFDVVRRLTGKPPHLSSGGRLQMREFGEYYEFLFGSAQVERGRWTYHPFRELLRKVHEVTSQLAGRYPLLHRDFRTLLRSECVKYHWILPKVNDREFHQIEGKKGYRPWYSVFIPQYCRFATFSSMDVVEHFPNCPPLCYGGSRYTNGTLPPFPEVLSRKRSHWIRSLRRHADSTNNEHHSATPATSDSDESLDSRGSSNVTEDAALT